MSSRPASTDCRGQPVVLLRNVMQVLFARPGFYSGNRIYMADGLNLSCNTLKQFAQTAITRIGR